MGGSSVSSFIKQNIIFLNMFMILFMSCVPEKTSIFQNNFLPSTQSKPLEIVTSSSYSLETLIFDGHLSFQGNHFASSDFGNRYHLPPLAVLHPKSVLDISIAVKHVFETGSSSLKVAARGHGHSLQGQAQAHQGLVINMESLDRPEMEIFQGEISYVDVSGGELWINVLHECLKHGLAPKSWTDYLHLSVGGTLSNAGISGQAFRHGPQINNVHQLEVVTGKGDTVICSEKQNPDLFFAVLGGLGQFGIITRARISLAKAPKMVKWIRALYSDFSTFTADQEHLISSKDSVDYVEGFVIINRTGLLNNWRSSFNPRDPLRASQFVSDGRTLYCLEIAKYFNPDETDVMNKKVESLLSELSYISSTLIISEVPYLDFLDRVHVSEKELRAKGLWEIPHPWLNLLIPKTKIHDFANRVFGNILTDTSNGPILIYPVDKSRFNNRTSLATPDEDIFYLVAFLSSAVPSSTGRDGLEHILAQNDRILDHCEAEIAGYKQYLPHYSTQEEWRAHFGQKWELYLKRKSAYDPRAILAPGQRIFQKAISFL